MWIKGQRLKPRTTTLNHSNSLLTPHVGPMRTGKRGDIKLVDRPYFWVQFARQSSV